MDQQLGNSPKNTSNYFFIFFLGELKPIASVIQLWLHKGKKSKGVFFVCFFFLIKTQVPTFGRFRVEKLEGNGAPLSVHLPKDAWKIV